MLTVDVNGLYAFIDSPVDGFHTPIPKNEEVATLRKMALASIKGQADGARVAGDSPVYDSTGQVIALSVNAITDNEATLIRGQKALFGPDRGIEKWKSRGDIARLLIAFNTLSRSTLTSGDSQYPDIGQFKIKKNAVINSNHAELFDEKDLRTEEAITSKIIEIRQSNGPFEIISDGR